MAVTKTMTVPKLRFHEFNDEWQVKKLGNIISKISSGVSVNSEDRPKISGEVGILKTSAVYDGQFKPEENKRILGDEIKRAKLHPVKDSIIVSRMNTPDLVGEIGYVSQDFNELFIPDRLWLCKINSENSAKYLSYVLSSNKIRSVLKSLATGTSNSMKNISQPSFLAISITLPLESEQKKIAAFLTAVDDKCSILQQKIDLLKKYKKGASGAIFTQSLRFKDKNGKDFPAWQEKSLDAIGRIVGGGTPDTTRPEYWGGSIYWLTPTEVKNKYIDSSLRTITELGLKNSSAKILPVDTVIFTSRATVGDVAIAKVPIVTNQGFQSIVVNEKNNNYFIYYWAKLNKKEFLRKSSGSTFPEISSSEMKKISLRLPCIEEQKDIADFLTAADDKINLEESKLKQAKNFKKALLQQMFI